MAKEETPVAPVEEAPVEEAAPEETAAEETAPVEEAVDSARRDPAGALIIN